LKELYKIKQASSSILDLDPPVIPITVYSHNQIPKPTSLLQPAQVSLLRRWTSLEAMGDVTADLDCTHRVTVNTDDVDHRLPSPEEQVHAIALK
jgi:hypothetical protein